MIRNGREYRITKAQAKRFEQALAQLPKERSIEKGVHPLLAKAQKDAMQSQLQSLRKQIKDYERLRRRGGKTLDVTSIEKLPQTLIRARIAAGLTQKELATRVGIKEQQVQRYEATNYASASLARVLQVARILADVIADFLETQEGVTIFDDIERDIRHTNHTEDDAVELVKTYRASRRR